MMAPSGAVPSFIVVRTAARFYAIAVYRDGEGVMRGRGLKAFVTAGVCALGSVLGVPGAARAAGDANQASCPFETEASPGFRTYLPDCRAFELVTPPYKEGTALLEPAAISADGSQLIVGALGAFSGAGNFWVSPERNGRGVYYELARSTAGWQTSPLTPPASEYTFATLLAASATNFGETLWGAEHAGFRNHEDIYLRTGPGPSGFHRVGPGTPRDENGSQALESYEISSTEELNLVGASHDLTHSLYEIESSPGEALGNRNGNSNLWDGDTTEPSEDSLYEYVYTGAEDREPVLVGVRNRGPLDGSPHVNEHAELISNCGTELGSGGRGSAYNAVSTSGEAVFFTARACAGGPEVNELYARIDGESTVALSEPALRGGTAGECSPSEPCHGAAHKPATFEGASEDGSAVFFLSEQPLVNGASAEGMKLYEERLNVKAAQVEQVVDVSNVGVAGLDPEVLGVVRVSEEGEDGDRVYFVAKGVLAGKDRVAGREPEEERPVAGADNLYVYEPDPAQPGAYRTVFVATLLTAEQEADLEGEEAAELEGIKTQASNTFAIEKSEIHRRFEAGEFGSGPVAIEHEEQLVYEAEKREESFVTRTTGSRGPSGTVGEDTSVWAMVDDRPVQATPDGGFLVFPSSARLTPLDSSGVPQLFEYSADGESLTRVSIGASGPAGGNVATFQDSPHIPAQGFSPDLPTAAQTARAITADGSRVFFTSAAGLAPQAKEGARNVYEYSEGQVYLVSGGTDTSTIGLNSPTVRLVGVDASAQNVLFTTASPLVPQQGDTEPGVYDAREGGGFPAPVLEAGCFGEACRGASAPTPLLQAPASAEQAGGGNLPPVVTSKTNTKPSTKRARCKKGFGRNRQNRCVKRKKAKKAAAKRAGHDRRAAR
jgi:hypothetical protein